MAIRRWIVIVVALLALTLGVYAAMNLGGFSARTQPSTAERLIARAARRLAIPSRSRAAVNPVPFSPEVWAESRAHFADHCATCHANDGSGQTEMGQNLYPKAPDMRLSPTQDLTDGEIYWIIANGVRLTGMPAWGRADGEDADTWKLVHFIRRLKELTPEQLADMATQNPKTRAELAEELDDEQFLKGEDVPRIPSPHVH